MEQRAAVIKEQKISAPDIRVEHLFSGANGPSPGVVLFDEGNKFVKSALFSLLPISIGLTVSYVTIDCFIGVFWSIGYIFIIAILPVLFSTLFMLKMAMAVIVPNSIRLKITTNQIKFRSWLGFRYIIPLSSIKKIRPGDVPIKFSISTPRCFAIIYEKNNKEKRVLIHDVFKKNLNEIEGVLKNQLIEIDNKGAFESE